MTRVTVFTMVYFTLAAAAAAQKMTYEEAKQKLPDRQPPEFWVGDTIATWPTSKRPSFTKDIMPYYHVREGLPPSIMFFGTEDRLLGGAEEFREVALEKDNRCELLTWEGVGHGFFNFGRNNNKEFVATLKAADKFLASLGYVEGEPTVDRFMEETGNREDREK